MPPAFARPWAGKVQRTMRTDDQTDPGDIPGTGRRAILQRTYTKWPIMAAVVPAMLAVLYYLAPNARLPRIQWLSPGAVVALVNWIVGLPAERDLQLEHRDPPKDLEAQGVEVSREARLRRESERLSSPAGR